ncbi:MAG: hypothetical protein QM757_37975 [Paludibaculum sp.]
MIEILPSLLAADFARLGEQIAQVTEAGVNFLHFDVMDGHFVPNISFGVPVLQSLRKCTKLAIDVHLMIDDADTYAPLFVAAGADCVSVHQEACPHLDRTVRLIQSEGARAGVVLNPATPPGNAGACTAAGGLCVADERKSRLWGAIIHPLRSGEGSRVARATGTAGIKFFH